MTRPTAIFIALVAAAVVASTGYVALARREARPDLPPPVVVPSDAAPRIAAIRAGDHLVFRSMATGPTYGMLAVAPLDDRKGLQEATTLPCNRVYSAAGATACMAVTQSPGRPHPVYLLDDALAIRAQFDSPGAPSRVRVAGNGRILAITAFTARDSYLAFGFSTRTRLTDAATGQFITDLEELDVRRDGQAFRSVDFNFWGVTFTSDSRAFYATLSTKGQTYLVRGTVDSKTADVIRDNVECPSLAADGRRIAFKRRVSAGEWDAVVYDLVSGVETVLPGTRGLDDQLEWLDGERLLYGLRVAARGPRRANVWVVRADGSAPPALFLANAESPSVVRHARNVPPSP